MLDTGYRRGVIEGGCAVQEQPCTQEESLVVARLRFRQMREAGYTGVENEAAFLEGFHDGWVAACLFLVPMPALEEAI